MDNLVTCPYCNGEHERESVYLCLNNPNRQNSLTIQWYEEKLQWLLGKKQRELKYLERRAKRPGHVPTATDIAYEVDQFHEEDLIRVLQNGLKDLYKNQGSL